MSKRKRRSAWMTMVVLVSLQILLLVSWPAMGGETDQDGPLEQLHVLIGTWAGDIDGALGLGRGVRVYELVAGDQYLMSRHVSRRPPQEKSPSGDQHEQVGIFSYDRTREKVVCRQFVGEGFVVQYLCEVGPDGFVCEAENIESGPNMNARWTITLEGTDILHETFELAQPGKDLQVLFTNQWTRLR